MDEDRGLQRPRRAGAGLGEIQPNRTVTPNQTYGIIVDKMTQRLYLYKEGRLLTTLLCSTGTTSGGNSGHQRDGERRVSAVQLDGRLLVGQFILRSGDSLQRR